MNKSFPTILLFAAALSIAAPNAGSAQNAPAAQPPSAPPSYRPGLGDLMTMTVQPRHIKLALAVQGKNWAYATYELHELEEAFDRVTKVWPSWKTMPIAGVMGPITKEPMAALAQALQSANTEKFDAAYTQLTDACNACHHAANVGFVVIKKPDAPMFPDQDFTPGK